MKPINENHKLRSTSNPARLWPTMLAALLLTGLVQQAKAQTWAFSTAWTAANGIGHLANNNENRGIAYSAISNQVFVSTRASATTGSIDIFDGTAGTLLSGANGVVGANLGIDQIGIGDDGILYGAPLQTTVATGTPFQLYSWTNWNNSPYLAYQSTSANDPLVLLSGTKRVGDTMAVTGSGVNTLILATVAVSTGGCTNFVLLHTADGVNFSDTVVTVTSLPSIAGNELGITFYTNNTFLVQPGSGAASRNVYLVSYPANFASQSNVTGTVMGSTAGLSTAADEFLSYSPAGQMLGSIQTEASGSPCAVDIFSMTNYPTSTIQLASTTFATPNANGNATGGCALGGQGKTNYLYVLESDNGVTAYKITFTPGAVGPTLNTPTGGITNAYPPQTLSETVASGTAPFHYQWYVITSGVTNLISGATNSSYTATTPVTNLYFVVVTNAASSANVVTSTVVGLTLLVPVTNSVVTNLWNLPIGAYGFLANDNDARGLAYDTNLNVVAVSSTTGGNSVNLLNGDTGALIGTLSTAGLPNNNQFVIDQVGIADDGVVYGGCLDVGPAPAQYYTLNRWPAATNTAVATQAYNSGDPGSGSGDRWGDNMAVRGAGINTQVLLGANASANVVLFTTTDGMTFTPTLMSITGVPAGFAAKGVAFGAGNTFWAKNYGGDLFEIAYDPVALTNAVLLDYTISGAIPSRLVGLAVDMTNNILAGVNLLDINNDLQLYELTGSANPPVLFDQAFFPSYNVNGNDNAAIVMKNYKGTNRVYALDVNNGIVALTYGVPSATAATVTASPSSVSVYSADPSVVLSVSVSGSLPIYYQWQLNGTNIPNATNSTYALSHPPTNDSGSYDVVVHNIAGTNTSTAAVLTVYPPVTNADVTTLWTVAAGGTNNPYQSLNNLTYLTNYPYIDTTSYAARGLACDTNTSTVLVVNNGAGAYFGMYVLDANTGTNMFTMNTAGLNATGLLFVLDQVGVADDGVVYAANCTAAGSAANFTVYSWPNVSAGAGPAYAMNSTDPATGTANANADRWGDTMAVRGAGLNTQILLGSYYGFDAGPATNAALLTTTDGSDFTPLLLTITNATGVPAGFSMLGIAFGAGNTFWTASPGYDLRQIAFDPVSGNCSVLQNISAAASANSIFDSMGAICLDVTNNLLAGITFNDIPMDVSLYQVGSNDTFPYLFHQAFFPVVEANGQHNGATTVKSFLNVDGSHRIYSLDANNGIVALSYTVPLPAALTLVPFNITHVSDVKGTGVTLTWQSVPNFIYQVQVATTLSGVTTWANLGNPIAATGTTTSYTDSSADASLAAGYYQVVAY